MNLTHVVSLAACAALTACGGDLEPMPWSLEESAPAAEEPDPDVRPTDMLLALQGSTFVAEGNIGGCIQSFWLLRFGEARVGEIDFEMVYVDDDACYPDTHRVSGCEGVASEVRDGGVAFACPFEDPNTSELVDYEDALLIMDDVLRGSRASWSRWEVCEDEERLARNAPLTEWCATR